MDNNNLNSTKLQIENARQTLNKLIIEKKYNLLDSEVIKLSQLLDKLLSEYERMIK